jgi:hypothetical protein
MAYSFYLPWRIIASSYTIVGITVSFRTGYPLLDLSKGIVLGGFGYLIIPLIGGFVSFTSLFRKRLGVDVFVDVGIATLMLLFSDFRIHLAQIGCDTPEARSFNMVCEAGSGPSLTMGSCVLLLIAAGITTLMLMTPRTRAAKFGKTVNLGTTAYAKPSSGLRGSFPLNEQTINEEVIIPSSAGVYSLGRLREKTFLIQHIGRSDTDVQARLKEYIGKYDRFKFAYADSSEAAFIKECQLYHAFGGKIPHNENHPERSQGATWSCPRCAIFESTKPQSVVKTGKRFCGQCGAEVAADVQFCTSCGKEVTFPS